MTRSQGATSLFAAALLAVLANACTMTSVTRGKPLDPESARAMHPGDTRASVITRLGPPTSTEIVRGGTRFHYVFKSEDEREISVSPGQGSMTFGRENYKLDRITVLFDHHGLVKEIGWPHGVGLPPTAPRVATKPGTPKPSDDRQTGGGTPAGLPPEDGETGSKRP